MNIKFLGTKVSKLSLVVFDDKEIEDDFHLSFVNGYPDESSENDKNFVVIFSVRISSAEEKFKLELEYTGFFETDETITEEFKTSHFPTTNAPAIAYPFMRSFINTITVNSDLKPVVLPTINFVELVRRQKEAENAN